MKTIPKSGLMNRMARIENLVTISELQISNFEQNRSEIEIFNYCFSFPTFET